MTLPKAIERIIIDEVSIAKRVQTLAEQISADYKEIEDEGIVLIGVLRGAFIFMADLARRLKLTHEVDFVSLSSYDSGGSVSGAVRLIMDTRQDLKNKHVIIVEDILDTGFTLDYLLRNFSAREPASLKTSVLLSKPARHKITVNIDYLGFEIPDVWVVGYGLDYANQFRTLPYIAELKYEIYVNDTL